jgi:hypothetical protein
MNDAHENEYAAAVAGMQETYGSPRHADTYAVGDHITFRMRGWSDRSYDDGRVINHHDGRLIVETASDIVELDPRPWPTGNVLPF